MADPETASPGLDLLRALLASARGIVDDIAGDPILDRAMRAFQALPEADRETIISVLERDATWCRIVKETAGVSGIKVRPNPHASLYVHVCDPAPDQPIASEPSDRDLTVIRLGIERFVALLPLFFQEGVHAQWTASARELIRAAPPELRAIGVRLANEVLALIADADTKPA